VVIALVVTPDGLPLAYEVLPGNTADCKTLVIAHPIPTGYTPLKINHIFP
jgi:transposase